MTMQSNYMTGRRIIEYAYVDAGIVAKGQSPSGSQYTEGMNRLNDTVNLLQTQGLKLWLVSDTPVTLVAGQNKYQFKPGGDVNMTKPLKVMDGYWLDASNNPVTLISLAWSDWIKLPNQSQQGAINSYFVDHQQTHLDVYFWLTPDSNAAAGTAHVILRNQVVNFSSLTDTANFPIEWAMCLRWMLADDLSTGQPEEIVMRCEKRAAAFRQALEDWDVEDASTYFAPDSRTGGYHSSFS